MSARKAPRTRGTRPRPPFPPQHQPKPGLEERMRPRPEYHGATYLPAGKLRGRRALVTGGDSGIGRSVAVLFAREGADVAIVYVPQEEDDAHETKGAVEDAGRTCVLLPGDVADAAWCRQAVDEAVERLGGLDILVNNAAFQEHRTDLDELTVEQWDRTFKVNIYGYFHMVKAALPHLNRGASIINCSSITGLEGSKGLVDYSSTKGAINAFTKSLAQNLTERGIRVNAVAPGPVWTPLNVADRSPDDVAEFGGGTPYGRPAQPDEIAPAFVFFASAADSGYVTGEVLTLLGGQTRAG